MPQHIVLRVIVSLLLPFIILFAFYVQVHGEVSPGGGFQAGVILATAVVLHALAFGVHHTKRAVPESLLRFGAALGILIYGGVGAITMFFGGLYLDYNRLDSHAPSGQQLGITLVEIGVGITVGSVMLLLYYLFATRQQEK